MQVNYKYSEPLKARLSRWFKTFRWNFGIEIIHWGYVVRDRWKFWELGKLILLVGHNFRGEVPMKDWWPKKVLGGR